MKRLNTDYLDGRGREIIERCAICDHRLTAQSLALTTPNDFNLTCARHRWATNFFRFPCQTCGKELDLAERARSKENAIYCRIHSPKQCFRILARIPLPFRWLIQIGWIQPGRTGMDLECVTSGSGSFRLIGGKVGIFYSRPARNAQNGASA